jgi:hypothetical protein
MKTKIEVTLSRDLLVQVLRAYMTQACPSAVGAVVSHALTLAAMDLRAQERGADAEWLDRMAKIYEERAMFDRSEEDAHFLEKSA